MNYLLQLWCGAACVCVKFVEKRHRRSWLTPAVSHLYNWTHVSTVPVVILHKKGGTSSRRTDPSEIRFQNANYIIGGPLEKRSHRVIHRECNKGMCLCAQWIGPSSRQASPISLGDLSSLGARGKRQSWNTFHILSVNLHNSTKWDTRCHAQKICSADCWRSVLTLSAVLYTRIWLIGRRFVLYWPFS